MRKIVVVRFYFCRVYYLLPILIHCYDFYHVACCNRHFAAVEYIYRVSVFFYDIFIM